MEYYDYREAVCADIEQYLRDTWSKELFEIAFQTRDYDDVVEELYEDLWVEDSVTGNGSGSYTFDRDLAMEYLSQNFDLLAEAVQEFGGNVDVIKDGPEVCDVTIRCYLLRECIDHVCEMAKDDEEYLNAIFR